MVACCTGFGVELCIGAFAASSPRSQLYVTSLKTLHFLHSGVSECLGDLRGLLTAVPCIHAPAGIFICRSICLAIRRSVYLSVCGLPIYLNLPTYPSTLSVCLSACLSNYLSIHLSRSLPLCIPLPLCLYLSNSPSIFLSTYLSTYLPIYLCIKLSFYLSIYRSNDLSISLLICRSIYLSIYLSIHS